MPSQVSAEPAFSLRKPPANDLEARFIVLAAPGQAGDQSIVRQLHCAPKAAAARFVLRCLGIDHKAVVLEIESKTGICFAPENRLHSKRRRHGSYRKSQQ